jgi:hypothetical protein
VNSRPTGTLGRLGAHAADYRPQCASLISGGGFIATKSNGLPPRCGSLQSGAVEQHYCASCSPAKRRLGARKPLSGQKLSVHLIVTKARTAARR